MIFAFLLILSLIMFFTTAYHETFSCPSIVRLLLVASNNPIQTCLRKRKRIQGYLGAFLRTRDLRNGLRPGKECHCGGDGLSLSGPLVTASLENWLPPFQAMPGSLCILGHMGQSRANDSNSSEHSQIQSSWS